MSLIAKLILSLTGPGTVKAFERQCRHPLKAQEKLLHHILEKNKDTAFGKEHEFRRIKTMRAFQKAVPISTYEDIKPYIDAELGGKPNQLTSEKPMLFAMTSGTTGAAKYIPVTAESRGAKADLMKVWLSSFFKDHPDIFSERVLSIVSPEVESHAPDGTPCGSESGHAYRNIPAAIRSLYVCPYEVFEIEDYEARYYTILRIAVAQSLSLIATVNPSTLLVLCERLEQHTDSIIRHVRQGGLPKDLKVPHSIREKIASHLKPDPQRADELEKLAAKNKGKLTPKFIWPKLAAIACWQGGTVGTYLEKLRPYFPEEIPIRDLGYLASEQRGSVPLFDNADTGVLAISTNVYEFYPAEKEHKPRRTDLLAVNEVKLGHRYYIYVTTLGGLYRYDMSDIVEVVAYYEKTPMIRFVQKGKGIVSFTGEKLSEAQVLVAAEEAFKLSKNKHEFISAVGEMEGDTPRYVFLAEFDKVPGNSQLREISKALDDSLSRQNSEYASKRKSLRLDPPAVRVVRRGEFDKYRKRKTSKGRSDGQFKILRLTDKKEFAEEFATIREVDASTNGKRKRQRKVARKGTDKGRTAPAAKAVSR
jgi:hypothetical protein